MNSATGTADREIFFIFTPDSHSSDGFAQHAEGEPCFAVGPGVWSARKGLNRRAFGEPQRLEEGADTEAHREGELPAATADELG